MGSLGWLFICRYWVIDWALGEESRVGQSDSALFAVIGSFQLCSGCAAASNPSPAVKKAEILKREVRLPLLSGPQSVISISEFGSSIVESHDVSPIL